MVWAMKLRSSAAFGNVSQQNMAGTFRKALTSLQDEGHRRLGHLFLLQTNPEAKSCKPLKSASLSESRNLSTLLSPQP